MDGKSIRIAKPDNQVIAARVFLPPLENLRCILVVCHGFRGSKDNGGRIFDFARRLNALGAGVYAFDFLGSGDSDGEFSEVTLSSQADDLEQVIDFVYTHHKLPIILLGRSFGGSTVIKAGSQDVRVKGFILWSAPVKLQATFATMLGDAYQELEVGQDVMFCDETGMFWISPVLISDFACHDMDEYLGLLGERPVLIIQGMADEVVAPANAHYIFSHCSNAEMVLLEGADHRCTNKTREREDITIKWLEKNF